MAFVGASLALIFILFTAFFGPTSDVGLKALLMVSCGVLAASLVLIPLYEYRNLLKAFVVAFSRPESHIDDTIEEIIKLGKAARKNGRLAMTRMNFSSAYMEKACHLVAENAIESRVHKALDAEMRHLVNRHLKTQSVIRSLGVYAPAFGLGGTVLSLAMVMSAGGDKGAIEQAILLALMTTMYGAVLSFSIFNPVARRLKYKTAVELNEMEVIRDGLISIMNNENTTHVSEHVSSALPSSKRTKPEAPKPALKARSKAA